MAKKVDLTLMQRLEAMKAVILDVEGDATKFDNGNNAAGGRVRKILKELPKMVKDVKLFTLNKL